jgi:peroxiredoxin
MNFLSAMVMLLFLLMVSCSVEKEKIEIEYAPSFTLYDTDSIAHNLNKYQNQLIMIHFWADWCPNCRKEFPKLQRAYQELRSDGFELIAINSGQTREHVREIKDTYGLTFPLLVDEEAITAKEYNVAGLPTTFFVDGAGKIRQKHVGWLDDEQIIRIYNSLKSKG